MTNETESNATTAGEQPSGARMSEGEKREQVFRWLLNAGNKEASE